MAINEVIVNGVTELSLVNDTVSEASLLEGETAHAASGEAIVGKAKYINPNLIDNPDFSIDQRSFSGDFSEVGKYFVDRWILDSGTVTINANGSILLNGTISQKLEKAVNGVFVAQASAGVASYDDVNKIFTVSATNEVISWAKLEVGSVPTPFVPPNTAVELVKCQRYYAPVFKTNGTPVQFNGAGIAVTNTMVRLLINLPNTLRIATPTAVLTGSLYLINSTHITNNSIPVKNINGLYVNGNILQLDVNVEGVTLENSVLYMLSRRNMETTLALSADL